MESSDNVQGIAHPGTRAGIDAQHSAAGDEGGLPAEEYVSPHKRLTTAISGIAGRLQKLAMMNLERMRYVYNEIKLMLMIWYVVQIHDLYIFLRKAISKSIR